MLQMRKLLKVLELSKILITLSYLSYVKQFDPHLFLTQTGTSIGNVKNILKANLKLKFSIILSAPSGAGYENRTRGFTLGRWRITTIQIPH